MQKCCISWTENNSKEPHNRNVPIPILKSAFLVTLKLLKLFLPLLSTFKFHLKWQIQSNRPGSSSSINSFCTAHLATSSGLRFASSQEGAEQPATGLRTALAVTPPEMLLHNPGFARAEQRGRTNRDVAPVSHWSKISARTRALQYEPELHPITGQSQNPNHTILNAQFLFPVSCSE